MQLDVGIETSPFVFVCADFDCSTQLGREQESLTHMERYHYLTCYGVANSLHHT